jgi:thiol-disulfide isomerase/thioredoxin
VLARTVAVLWLSVSCSLAAPVLVAAKKPYVEGGVLSFSLHDLEGRTVTSEDERFRGKVVMVDVFGTWCTPCLTEIPTLREMHEKYADDGLVLVAIAFEHGEHEGERRNYLRYFVNDNSIEYLVLDGGAVDQFRRALPGIRNVKGFPIEIFIDREGKVVETRNGFGYKEHWASQLEERLVEMLKPPAPTAQPASTPD